jgi:hypothetical protein
MLFSRHTRRHGFITGDGGVKFQHRRFRLIQPLRVRIYPGLLRIAGVLTEFQPTVKRRVTNQRRREGDCNGETNDIQWS